jgi:hypothetical protein
MRLPQKSKKKEGKMTCFPDNYLTQVFRRPGYNPQGYAAFGSL